MIHRIMMGLARAMALCGGVVLMAVIGVVCVSVIGRELADLAYSGVLGAWGDRLIALGVGPILGDFELVEAGVAFAIFAFLPLTQMTGAHARVDVFARSLGARADRILAVFWTVVLAAIMVLITWRLSVGMMDRMRFNEITYLLQFPVWWAYAAGLVGAVAASLVSLYCAARALTGHPVDE